MNKVVAAILLAVMLLAVVGVAACADPASDEVDFTPPPEPEPSYTGPDTIAWSEASSVIGQRMIVEGPVVSVDDLGGGDVALNVGLDAPSTARFVVIVPAAVVRGLPAPPADLYEGRLVRVTGVVEDYEGSGSIRVKSAKAIKRVAPTGAGPSTYSGSVFSPLM